MAERNQLAFGLEAHERAAKIGPTATSLTLKTGTVLGEITIDPGTVWGEGQKLIVNADGSGIAFFDGDTLYLQSPKDFVMDELVSVFAKAGTSAKPWRKILKTEFNLICGLLVPWYGSVGILAAETTLFYANNKEIVDLSVKHIDAIIVFLSYLKDKHPVLWRKLMFSLASNSILGSSHAGPADAAFVIGRILKGYREFKADKENAKGAAAGVATATLKVVVLILLQTAAIFLLLHAPVFAIKGFVGDSKKQIAEFLKEFKSKLGVAISEDEAKAIRDSLLKDLSASEKFGAFADDAHKGLTAIEKLISRLDEEMLLD